MKNVHLILILSILGSILISSPSMGQAWKKEFPKDVNLIKMTDAGIAIVGTDDALYAIDENGKELWKNEKLKKVEENRVEVLPGSEFVFISDKGLLSRNRVLNVYTGKEFANSGYKGDNIMGAKYLNGSSQFWVSKGPSSINVWDANTNTLLYNWNIDVFPGKIDASDMASMTVTFAGTQPVTYTGKNTAIVHLSLAQLSHFDLTTGKAKWHFDWKPYKPKADKGDRASSPSRGYSIMKIDDATNTLYFPFRDRLISINVANGCPNWDIKKGGKTGKVRDMYIIKEGILVLVESGIQLVDKKTGNLLWKKPIKLKNAYEALLIKDGNDFYSVSKGSIVKIDVAAQSSKSLTSKIKFSGGETFSSLEIEDEYIIMSASQNVVALKKSTGEILHQTYLKAPGQGVVALAQNMALASISMAATMNSYNVNSQSSSGSTFRYHQYSPRIIESGGSATTNSGGVAYISTKFKDEDAKGFGIAKVDKKTGKILDKIVIGNRDPIYAVNHRDGKFFYKNDKKSIAMRNLN